jgi:hypothetical protein
MGESAYDGIKSMPVFFLDNKHMWPESAVLLKNLVLWPDSGKYPSFAPVAVAQHPQLDGKIVVQAGNRSIVVTILPGAQSQADIRKGMSAKGAQQPEQYRIAVDALIHSVMLMKAALAAGSEAGADLGGVGDINALTVLNVLKDMPEGQLLRDALTCYLNKGEPPPDRYTATEELLQSLSHEATA